MKRLGRWLESKPAPTPEQSAYPWRVGTPGNRGLYQQQSPGVDRFMGIMETVDLAEFVMKAVNCYHSLAPAPEVLHGKKQKQKHRGPTSLLGDK